MRVLLTGSDGYLGQVVGPGLLAAGHDVVGLDTRLYAAATFGPPGPDLPTVVRDLRDVRAEDVAGVDAVVHLAALSNDPLGDLAPETTFDVNHLASVRLARLARDCGVGRFLYASTCSVYGAHGGEELVDETATMAPVTPYALSKVRVEEDLHEMADADFSPVYLRNATCYGVSPRLRLDIVLNDLVARAVLTGVVTVLSDGTPWRPLVHVQDVGTAVTAVLEAPREAVHDQAFNVGRADGNHQVRDVARLAAAAVPGSRVEVTGETGADPRSYRVDFSKIVRRLPAFTPRWTVQEGARELAEAYRAHALTADDVVRFTRLRELHRRRSAGELSADLRPVDGP